MSKGKRIKGHLTNDEKNDMNRLTRKIKDLFYDIAFLQVQLEHAIVYRNPDEHIEEIHSQIDACWKQIEFFSSEIDALAKINEDRRCEQNGSAKQKDYHRKRNNTLVPVYGYEIRKRP